MTLRTEIILAVLALLLIQIVTSFGAIALLTRLSPAVEHILKDNVASIRAVEDMRAALAMTRLRGPGTEAAARFRQALKKARDNITEPGEQLALAQVEAHGEAALRGEDQPLEATIAALEELASINHASIRAADRRVRQMSMAGAWAAVFLGLTGFVLSVVIIRRMQTHLLAPLAELYAAAKAFSGGDPHRRCRAADVPIEFQRVARSFNELLDERDVERRSHDTTIAQIDRAALLHLLDAEPGIAAIADRKGRILAGNRLATQALGDALGEALRRHAQQLATDGVPRREPGFSADDIGGRAWLVRLDPELQGGGDAGPGPGHDAVSGPGSRPG